MPNYEKEEGQPGLVRESATDSEESSPFLLKTSQKETAAAATTTTTSASSTATALQRGVRFMSHHMPTPNSSNRHLSGHNEDQPQLQFENDFKLQLHQKSTTVTSGGSSSSRQDERLLDWSLVDRKLYDREEQHSKLWRAHRRRRGSTQPELYLITGSPGTGKTALATSIEADIQRDGGFFCSGKFQHGTSNKKPYAPFVSVLRDLTRQIRRLDKGILTELQHQVAVDIGAEMHVLLEAEPSLRLVFPAELFALPSFAGTSSSINPVSHISSSNSQTEPQLRRLSNNMRLGGRRLSNDHHHHHHHQNLHHHHHQPMPRRLSNEMQLLRRLSGDPQQQLSEEQLHSSWASPETTQTRRTSTDSNTSYSSITGGYQIQPLPQNHFAVVFKRFIRVICTTKRPLLLFLDDLQWADVHSLELLEALLTPAGTASYEGRGGVGAFDSSGGADCQRGLMMLATCRASEVKRHHPLAQSFRRMEDGGVKILETKVHNLHRSALSQMIADVIRMPQDECAPLADIVYHETKGNVLYAKHYIQSLHDDEQSGILTTVTPQSQKNSIEERLVQLISRQMKGLSRDVQFLLQVASCLGGPFTARTLCLASQQQMDLVEDALEACRDQLGQHQLLTYDPDTQYWAFSHDKYQEAAYSLVPIADQQRFHLKLGRNMQAQLTEGQLPEYIVRVVDLMAVGMDYLMDEEERENLAKLCLQAGRKVALTCSFICAIDYMERGIRLLTLTHWKDQYSLSLDLYNAAAELAYCNGNHERAAALTKEIQGNAQCFLDRLQAYMISILSLRSRGLSSEATDTGLDCLTQLGHPLPKGPFCINREFNKAQKSLQSLTRQQILELPSIEDPNVMAAMTIIHMLHPIFSAKNPDYTTVTGSRLVLLSLKYGLGPMSAIGFALYSLTLVRMGKWEQGHTYGNLALQLLDRDSFRECSVKVFLTLSVGPIPAKKSYSEAMELMKKAWHLGLESGDIETALRASMCNALLRLYIGDPLWAVAKTIRELIKLCSDYGDPQTRALIQPYLQVCLHLVGCAKERFDIEHVRLVIAESNDDTILLYTLYSYYYLAMYLDRFDVIEPLWAEIRKLKTASQWLLPFTQTYQLFCEGVAAASQGRTKRDKLRVAHKKLAKLRKQGLQNPDNIWNKVCLLEAELEACSGRTDSAILMYDKAIQLAEKQGFLNEQALACERAGLLLLDSGRFQDAGWYVTRARALYKKWGANTKVEQLVYVLDEDKHAKCYVATGSGGSLQTD